MAGITPTWKEISHTLGFVLMFLILAFRLYQGDSMINAIMWAGIVFFVFNILSIILTNVLIKILHDYELRRLIQLAEEEEDEEERLLEGSDD